MTRRSVTMIVEAGVVYEDAEPLEVYVVHDSPDATTIYMRKKDDAAGPAIMLTDHEWNQVSRFIDRELIEIEFEEELMKELEEKE